MSDIVERLFDNAGNEDCLRDMDADLLREAARKILSLRGQLRVASHWDEYHPAYSAGAKAAIHADTQSRARAAWQPIATAPKDGTHFWAWVPTIYGGKGFEVQWDDDRYGKRPKPRFTGFATTLYSRGDSLRFQPTHWMPLPERPEAE